MDRVFQTKRIAINFRTISGRYKSDRGNLPTKRTISMYKFEKNIVSHQRIQSQCNDTITLIGSFFFFLKPDSLNLYSLFVLLPHGNYY